MIWLLILVMTFLGAPLFLVIGSVAYKAYALVPQTAMGSLEFGTFFSEIMDKLAASSLFITIPFFAFAGFLLAESNAPKRLVNLCRSFLGWLPGGLGIVAIFTCAIFTAFTGASGVTIIALGGLLYPALAQDNYPEKFRLGLLTTCGSLGLLFPPSLPLILYALVASNSVDKNFFPDRDPSTLVCNVGDLFLAGILPGILLVGILATYTVLVHKKAQKELEKENINETASDAETAKIIPSTSIKDSFLEAIYEIPLPIFIIGGIYGGFLTVDHGACFLVAYVFFVEVFIYRDIPLSKVPRIVEKTVALVGAIIIILAMAIGFSNYLIYEEIPSKILIFMQNNLYQITFGVLLNLILLVLCSASLIFTPLRKKSIAVMSICFVLLNLFLFTKGISVETARWVESIVPQKLAFLIVLNVFLLVVGCLMDIFSAILVVVPIIVPLAYKFNVNPYHLGIIFLTNLEIGYSTPPVGINLFISSLRFQKPIITLYMASISFIVLLLFALALITYVPAISLFLLS